MYKRVDNIEFKYIYLIDSLKGIPSLTLMNDTELDWFFSLPNSRNDTLGKL